MKKSVWTKIKTWWTNLSDEERGYIKGSFVGSFGAALSATLIARHIYDKEIDDITKFAAEECKKAYRTGTVDGRMMAYKDVISGPARIFDKMGMKKETF